MEVAMFTAQREAKLFEELYLSFLIIQLLFLLNVISPMFSKFQFKPIAIVYSLYLVVRIGLRIRSLYFLHKLSLDLYNTLWTLSDGLFLTLYIFSEAQSGAHMHELFYPFIIIQSMRFHQQQAWKFSFFVSLCYGLVVLFSGSYTITIMGHLVTVVLFFGTAILISLPLRELAVLRVEKEDMMDALKAKNAELEDLARTDYLTSLSNHQSFHTYIKRLKKLADDQEFSFSVTLIDIDNFKRINDTYGHLAGDHVLKEISQVLKSAIRQTDFAARYGGEEFAIIFPKTEIHTSVVLCERIRSAVESHKFLVDGQCIPVTISLGTATYHGNDPQERILEFIHDVDTLLYQAKHNGKNQVQFKKIIA